MGLFDKMKQAASAAGGNQTVTFTFQELPESLAQMQALPEASLDTPFKTAALTVCALCAYGADKNIGKEMLNWLRGPRPLNGQDISFLNFICRYHFFLSIFKPAALCRCKMNQVF